MRNEFPLVLTLTLGVVSVKVGKHPSDLNGVFGVMGFLTSFVKNGEIIPSLSYKLFFN